MFLLFFLLFYIGNKSNNYYEYMVEVEVEFGLEFIGKIVE